MDLSFLDKSSNVTPLLVRLYDSRNLYDLAKDKQPEARAELTNVVSALLDMDLSVRESELVADILIELIRQAEKDLKMALSERLSAMDKAPLRLILQIANDEIDVAGAVLKESAVLGDMDLIYIIKSKDAAHWRAIAQRKAMSDQLMGALVDTKDLETAITLTKNENITLSEYVLGVLSDIAQNSDDLAQPLLRRDEVDADLAQKLYGFVGEALKAYIDDHYTGQGKGEASAKAVKKEIDGLVFEMSEAAQSADIAPTQTMLKAADRFKSKDMLSPHLMMNTLKRGQIASFVAQFSRFTNLSPETILELLRQSSGQGLAVVCKAYHITKADFVSIYLQTNRVRSSGALIDTHDMAKAVSYFNRIKPEVARSILENSADGENITIQ